MTTQTAPQRVISPPGLQVPLALVGPTASGKTEAAARLATRVNAEILLLDSMTVYRGMDIGTAKPSGADRDAVRHHLVDVAEPLEAFSVAEFQEMAFQALADVRTRGRSALLVGGSGLYYRAVVDRLEFPGTDPMVRGSLQSEAQAIGPTKLHERLAELDPRAAGKIEPSNARRTVRALEVAAITGRPFSSFGEDWGRYPEDRVRAAGVRLSPESLRSRIEARARGMLEAGLLEETRLLLERGAAPLLTASQAIGYAEAAEHLGGEISLEEALERIVRRTKALARRQMAWFRRDPRIRWFDAESAVEVVDEIEEYFRR